MPIPMALTVRHAEWNEDGAAYQDMQNPSQRGHPGYTYTRCARCGKMFLRAWNVPADCIQYCGDPHCGQPEVAA